MHKVLLVDDDDEFRTVMALALESNGYAVTEVPDGVAALAALRRERPDAILCDLHMPLMDGRALCKRVRAEAELATIPFVLLSAYIESDGADALPEPSPDDWPEVLPDGLQDTPVDGCFSKQDSLSLLLPRLERLIEHHRQ